MTAAKKPKAPRAPKRVWLVIDPVQDYWPWEVHTNRKHAESAAEKERARGGLDYVVGPYVLEETKQ